MAMKNTHEWPWLRWIKEVSVIWEMYNRYLYLCAVIHQGYRLPLKDKSEVGMIDASNIQVKYKVILLWLVHQTLSHYFSPSCKITYSIKLSARNDVISHKQKRGCSIAFSPLNHCWACLSCAFAWNGDIETKCSLNYQNNFGINGRWKAQSDSGKNSRQ